MNIQRLRNLTTHRLHTKMDDIYEDLEYFTGQKGLFTHMLPRVCDAITPWLKKNLPNPRFWDGKFDESHTGEISLPEPTAAEREEMMKLYAALPSPW